MKFNKEKIKEWFEDKLDDIHIWWKWNYDWVLVAVGAIIFGVLLAMFGCYCQLPRGSALKLRFCV